MEKISRLASGTYGIVYKAKMNKKDENTVAVKRNVIDSDVSFSGSLRELDLLSRLRGHTNIVKLLSVSFGNPFKVINSPLLDRKGYNYKEDYLHFIFEEADKNLHNLIYEREVHVSYLKLAMVQILLGIEYMHSKGVIHRDIKPANLLWFVENDRPSVKLCDFGLSRIKTDQEPSSPGVVTSWYRAPEICLKKPDYSFASDIWSVGCVFYEMIARNALLLGTRDDEIKLLNKMAEIMPILTEEDYRYLSDNGKNKLTLGTSIILNNRYELIRNLPSSIRNHWENGEEEIVLFFHSNYKECYVKGKFISESEINKKSGKVLNKLALKIEQISDVKYPLILYPVRKSWKEQIEYSKEDIEEFEKYPDPKSSASYNNFISLLDGLLCIKPEKRFNATQALKHDFFSPYSNIIDWNRQNFPPERDTNLRIKIIDCKERKWATKIAFTLFNERLNLDWYSHRIIFQSLDLFDRYLDYSQKRVQEGNVKQKVETDWSGKMMNRYDTELRYLVCLYMSIKYFTTLIIPINFRELASKEYKTPKALIEAEEFEKSMLKDVLGFKVFRETVFEIADFFGKKYTEHEIRDLLLAYGTSPTREIHLHDYYKELLSSLKS